MEFAGKADAPKATDGKKERVIPFDKKATVCGECVVLEDIVEEKEAVAPVDRLLIPSDIVEIKDDDEAIYIIGTREGKVTKIRGLENVKQLKSLVLRSCLISQMEGIEHLTLLDKLELYDNHIEVIQGIDAMSNLTILDLSFNSIREMVPLGGCCPLLQELYVAQNKLRRIEGLEGLVHLRTLDLGANRIRVIEGLETCTGLQSLWLGKNKIEVIAGLSTNTQLRQLDIQNNRLTQLGDGLQGLSELSELYLAWNAIENVQGLPSPSKLNTVDLGTNKLNSLEGVEQHTTLEELWLSSSLLETFDSLTPLTKLPGLKCLYLEHSPIAKDFEYRKTTTRMILTLEQLDATRVSRENL
ncbi:hypothetical protein B484DRAFT_447427 [Ochromonadaceae sp. CCMP2298]|nr:hypothetical protein B484DRAFT_447427 [Ochromonadaceae sp. CCMP2298]|mmetsp:Transcript_12549/g.27867  ORF Transcript_12549/g.27867 Transcript_12549/m.27867 type:complete len:356 (+) Transcript_12549:70-1137(+)